MDMSCISHHVTNYSLPFVTVPYPSTLSHLALSPHLVMSPLPFSSPSWPSPRSLLQLLSILCLVLLLLLISVFAAVTCHLSSFPRFHIPRSSHLLSPHLISSHVVVSSSLVVLSCVHNRVRVSVSVCLSLSAHDMWFPWSCSRIVCDPGNSCHVCLSADMLCFVLFHPFSLGWVLFVDVGCWF